MQWLQAAHVDSISADVDGVGLILERGSFWYIEKLEKKKNYGVLNNAEEKYHKEKEIVEASLKLWY